MKIGLTYDLKSDWVWKPTDPKDANAELDKPKTVDELSAALEAGGHDVVRIGGLKNLVNLLPNLEVDIVFNICEGLS
ncbi:MAG: D-alanine--D-alanine ligase, partial [Candidatus Omnitrophica bacterium]|nr:D-alanine--D-alanine ligase [Candidatus Omnitrophota bacterium]